MTRPTTADDQPTSVHRSVEVDAPIEDVWDVVVDDEERAGWFGGPTELTPAEGTDASFTDPDGTSRTARVDSVVPGRHLGWTWWDDDDGAAPSRVTIDLTPSPTGTRIDVVEAPLSARACAFDRPSAFGGHGRIDPMLELEHRLLILASTLLRRALRA